MVSKSMAPLLRRLVSEVLREVRLKQVIGLFVRVGLVWQVKRPGLFIGQMVRTWNSWVVWFDLLEPLSTLIVTDLIGVIKFAKLAS